MGSPATISGGFKPLSVSGLSSLTSPSLLCAGPHHIHLRADGIGLVPGPQHGIRGGHCRSAASQEER